MRKIPPGVGPRYPQVLVLVGATGDLSRRKLLPGLFFLCSSGFIPDCRIVGVSLEDFDTEGFRTFARSAVDQFGTRKIDNAEWDTFAKMIQYVPLSAGADGLRAAVESAEAELGSESRRLHYLSVPPSAALSVVRMLGDAGLVDRSRIIMEKPFGTDLASAVTLNSKLHEVFQEEQIFRIDHFLGKEPAQNILAFRFANGLFEPIWNRNFIDHVQIDVPEKLGLDNRAAFYEQTGAFRDMVRHASVPDPRVHGDGTAHVSGARPDQRGKEQSLPLHDAAGSERRGARVNTAGTAAKPASIASPTPKRSSRSSA